MQDFLDFVLNLEYLYIDRIHCQPKIQKNEKKITVTINTIVRNAVRELYYVLLLCEAKYTSRISQRQRC